LAGVGGPRDPTNARGTMTTLLKHQELADKAQETEMTTSHVDATRPPSVTFFGTLILRSFSFDCLFHLSVFLFIVSLLSFLLFRVTVSATRGGWNNTRWPQNLELRWLHASGLSSCGLSFYRSPFSSFSFLFLQFLFSSSQLR
jgi:hypothetical protein